MYEPNNKKYKLVFLGEQSVGKTAVITRFMYDTFSDNYQATIGIDFLAQTLFIDEKAIKLQIWDTAGQERFRSLTPAYIRDSNVAIIVYDITNERSFNMLSTWVDSVRMERGNDVVMVIVGNKVDLECKRKVDKTTGTEKAKELNAVFIETSAKSGNNVKKLFQMIGVKLLEKQNCVNEVVKSIPVPLPQPSVLPEKADWCSC